MSGQWTVSASQRLYVMSRQSTLVSAIKRRFMLRYLVPVSASHVSASQRHLTVIAGSVSQRHLRVVRQRQAASVSATYKLSVSARQRQSAPLMFRKSVPVCQQNYDAVEGKEND